MQLTCDDLGGIVILRIYILVSSCAACIIGMPPPTKVSSKSHFRWRWPLSDVWSHGLKLFKLIAVLFFFYHPKNFKKIRQKISNYVLITSNPNSATIARNYDLASLVLSLTERPMRMACFRYNIINIMVSRITITTGEQSRMKWEDNFNVGMV